MRTNPVGTNPRRESDHSLATDLPDRMMPSPIGPWPEVDYRVWPNAKAGALLGGIAGCTSLLVNIIGSVLWPAFSGQEQHPLRLIQVYLTFPFGEYALQLNSGVLLASGCLLYIVTGALYGMLFELVVSYLLPRAGLIARLVAFTVLALCVWVLNFYALLAWLQPALFDGRWIMELVPWWIAAGTHLVFGWTMALLDAVRVDRSNFISTDTRRRA